MEKQLSSEEIENAFEKRIFAVDCVSTNERDLYVTVNGASYRIEYSSIHILS